MHTQCDSYYFHEVPLVSSLFGRDQYRATSVFLALDLGFRGFIRIYVLYVISIPNSRAVFDVLVPEFYFLRS